ncbi:MAG: hypothetical protein C5B54_01240 [Acidobacteria bacterium]|nr:MAG: hypothetical protein C5B54_01240 [Acidobacteriota bacterium]
MFLPMTIVAQDRVFAYTYQSNVLNKGDFDLEFQNTLRTGKVGAYSPYIFGQHLDQRLELEFGLGKKVQTAFYFNSELFHYADSSSSDMEQELDISFSNEWKWKFADPVANSVGAALYGEIEVGGSNVELEGKLIIDKQFQKDLFAMNLVGRYEVEKEVSRVGNVTKVQRNHNSPLEFDFAYMHFIRPFIGLGAELRNVNDITKENGWMNSVWFVGPAFHATIGKCFVNFSALPQLCNVHKTDSAPGSRDLNDFEATEFRLLVGYSF